MWTYTLYQNLADPTLRVPIALARPQRAPHRLQLDRLHAPPPHPERDVVQARERLRDVPCRPRPEDLCGRRGARPHGRVEVLGAGLHRPEDLLACGP